MRTTYPKRHAELRNLLSELRLQAPGACAEADELGKKAMAAGALSAAEKQLIALGIAIAAGSEGAIATHTEGALEDGATIEQVIECIAVAAYLGGEVALIHGTNALAALKGFSPLEQAQLNRLERAARCEAPPAPNRGEEALAASPAYG